MLTALMPTVSTTQAPSVAIGYMFSAENMLAIATSYLPTSTFTTSITQRRPALTSAQYNAALAAYLAQENSTPTPVPGSNADALSRMPYKFAVTQNAMVTAIYAAQVDLYRTLDELQNAQTSGLASDAQYGLGIAQQALNDVLNQAQFVPQANTLVITPSLLVGLPIFDLPLQLTDTMFTTTDLLAQLNLSSTSTTISAAIESALNALYSLSITEGAEVSAEAPMQSSASTTLWNDAQNQALTIPYDTYSFTTLMNIFNDSTSTFTWAPPIAMRRQALIELQFDTETASDLALANPQEPAISAYALTLATATSQADLIRIQDEFLTAQQAAQNGNFATLLTCIDTAQQALQDAETQSLQYPSNAQLQQNFAAAGTSIRTQLQLVSAAATTALIEQTQQIQSTLTQLQGYQSTITTYVNVINSASGIPALQTSATAALSLYNNAIPAITSYIQAMQNIASKIQTAQTASTVSTILNDITTAQIYAQVATAQAMIAQMAINALSVLYQSLTANTISNATIKAGVKTIFNDLLSSTQSGATVLTTVTSALQQLATTPAETILATITNAVSGTGASQSTWSLSQWLAQMNIDLATTLYPQVQIMLTQVQPLLTQIQGYQNAITTYVNAINSASGIPALQTSATAALSLYNNAVSAITSYIQAIQNIASQIQTAQSTESTVSMVLNDAAAAQTYAQAATAQAMIAQMAASALSALYQSLTVNAISNATLKTNVKTVFNDLSATTQSGTTVLATVTNALQQLATTPAQTVLTTITNAVSGTGTSQSTWSLSQWNSQMSTDLATVASSWQTAIIAIVSTQNSITSAAQLAPLLFYAAGAMTGAPSGIMQVGLQQIVTLLTTKQTAGSLTLINACNSAPNGTNGLNRLMSFLADPTIFGSLQSAWTQFSYAASRQLPALVGAYTATGSLFAQLLTIAASAKGISNPTTPNQLSLGIADVAVLLNTGSNQTPNGLQSLITICGGLSNFLNLFANALSVSTATAFIYLMEQASMSVVDIYLPTIVSNASTSATLFASLLIAMASLPPQTATPTLGIGLTDPGNGVQNLEQMCGGAKATKALLTQAGVPASVISQYSW